MIRKRTDADNDQIVHIWYKASRIAHPFLASDFSEKMKHDLRDIYIPNSETWVYENGGRVLGFISMLGNEIGGLFVLPDTQKNGIGTQLVNFVKSLHPELVVEVFEQNVIGRAFYAKYGFEPVSNYHHEETGQTVLRLGFKGD